MTFYNKLSSLTFGFLNFIISSYVVPDNVE